MKEDFRHQLYVYNINYKFIDMNMETTCRERSLSPSSLIQIAFYCKLNTLSHKQMFKLVSTFISLLLTNKNI